MIELIVKNSGIVTLQSIPGGDRGKLFVGEVSKQIPFPIERFFFIRDIKEPCAIRGGHTHHKSRQATFCLIGSFCLKLDDGVRRQSFVLDKPDLGIILEPMLWHEMTDFSRDCLILVLASNPYDEKDYIRDYQLFLQLVAVRQEITGC